MIRIGKVRLSSRHNEFQVAKAVSLNTYVFSKSFYLQFKLSIAMTVELSFRSLFLAKSQRKIDAAGASCVFTILLHISIWLKFNGSVW